MKYFAALILAAIFSAILFILATLVVRIVRSHYPAVPPPAPILFSQQYTSWHLPSGYCQDGVFRVEIDSSHMTIEHEREGDCYSSSYYVGRFTGRYFIARKRDTIVDIRRDTVFVLPACSGYNNFYTR